MQIRSIRGSNVTAAEHNLVLKFTKHCLRELCKKKYEVCFHGKPVTYREALTNCVVKTKYRSQASNGGAARICIDMQRYRSKLSSFKEYASFADDPVIGNIPDCNDRELLLKCLVAHEVAHHVQYRYGPHTRWLKNNYQKPHGDGFKNIYRELRRTLVNPKIKPMSAPIKCEQKEERVPFLEAYFKF